MSKKKKSIVKPLGAQSIKKINQIRKIVKIISPVFRDNSCNKTIQNLNTTVKSCTRDLNNVGKPTANDGTGTKSNGKRKLDVGTRNFGENLNRNCDGEGEISPADCLPSINSDLKNKK